MMQSGCEITEVVDEPAGGIPNQHFTSLLQID